MKGECDLAVTKQEVVHPGRPGEVVAAKSLLTLGQEAWMNIHKNAQLTPHRRGELVGHIGAGERAASANGPRVWIKLNTGMRQKRTDSQKPLSGG